MWGWGFLLAVLSPFFSHAISGWTPVDYDPTVVQINGRGGGGCTGTRISKDGYILTARHCFNGCLISGGFVDAYNLFPEYGWRSPKLYQLHQEAVCLTTIDGVAKKIKIVAIGPGFMTPMEQGSLNLYDKDLYLDFLQKSYLHNGDFAIIKEDVEGQSCRKVNWSSALDGEKVSFSGYPIQSSGRPCGRDSDGKSLLKGEGLVPSSSLDSSCVDSSLSNLDKLITRFDREDIMLSTVDNLPGASGSSLLNSSGEIVALINSQYRSGIDVESTYCSGTTVSIPTDHILRLLKETGFRRRVDEFFSCSIE